jgi:hypothetical protein
MLVDFLPRGETNDALRYCTVLDRLREDIQIKRAGAFDVGFTFVLK